MLPRLLCFIALLEAGGLVGCTLSVDGAVDGRGLEIGAAVQLLATSQGELAEQALRRILPHGRAALPYLEAALHRASPTGRRSLVVALRRLDVPEAAPLLGHIAAFDADLSTAREAWRTLSQWSSDGKPSPRSRLSASALRKVDEVRGAGTLLLDP
jgi:hypothetical protein